MLIIILVKVISARRQKNFQSILQTLPFLVANDAKGSDTINRLLTTCREYLIGLSIETTKRTLSKEANVDNTRIAELAAYFTHCELNENHLQLTLKLAINVIAKLKNYASLEDFARRLLDLSPAKQLQELAEKALKLVKQKGSTDFTKFNYDSRNPFVLCCSSLTPIYAGASRIICPFCGASYQNTFMGILCKICEISEVGKKVSGLEYSVSQTQARSTKRS